MPGGSAVFEAGEIVPQHFELFLVADDQRLIVQHHEVFFVVFCGTSSPVIAAVQQQFAIEDGVFVVHVPLRAIDPQLDSGVPESIGVRAEICSLVVVSDDADADTALVGCQY